MDPAPEGGRLGRYVLGALIGSGGMGEVYMATDIVLGRQVAIKFVTAAGGHDETLTSRLLQEARAIAALDHPCICPVFDADLDSAGRAYMVMQYVPGETLATRLARGMLPIHDAIRLCAGIADALAAAHSHGIIHRDLKPQNVIVTPSGQPKLLDFGIAKFVRGDDTVATTGRPWAHLTKSHVLLGTPGYMSPEQIQQKPLDGRSDLFGLGAILYECLAGRRAFEGENAVAVLGQILHLEPPPPSQYRRELDHRYDDLCQRLLAKEPADRFESANDVLGALRALGPDTTRNIRPPNGWMRRHWAELSPRAKYTFAAALLGSSLAFVAAPGMNRWLTADVVSVPNDAERWYQRGTEALREGAFHSASAAFEEAIRVFPDYLMAYARLAEARAEIDDERAAQQALVRLSERVSDESQLPRESRLRLEAIRSVVLRNVDATVHAYRTLAEGRDDAGAWLDFGRAQEAAGQLGDARASYVRALRHDPQYAAVHLRLGIIEGAEGRHQESLNSLSEAERLYQASSNAEGQAEVLIRRGAMLDAVGELRQARITLEHALSIARAIQSPSHTIRAEMHLSSVTASEGLFSDAEHLASSAVDSALDAGLETVAAEGLIDLAATLMRAARYADAEAVLRRAFDLADKRGASRTAARARTQRAALHLEQEQASSALEALAPALDFFRRHKYRRYELAALSIASRAYQQLDDIAKARELASEVLTVAESLRDEGQVALALGNLAAQATALGSLPEALALRIRAEEIHRRQRDVASLPYDVTNRAELLIRLGRLGDAEVALEEVAQGIEKGIDGYVGRRRRVSFLRALADVVRNDFRGAAVHAKLFAGQSAGADSASVLGSALLDFAHAKRRPTKHPIDPSGSPQVISLGSPAVARERQYWLATAALARGDFRRALDDAFSGLEQLADVRNDELEWRLAAVGSVAARQLGSTEQHRVLRARSSDALARLRFQWGQHAQQYNARKDLTDLRTAAGLSL